MFSVCKSAGRVCEENVVFDRRDGCVSSPIYPNNFNILKIILVFPRDSHRNKNIRGKWKNIVCC